MARIEIKDLPVDQQLDLAALDRVRGGIAWGGPTKTSQAFSLNFTTLTQKVMGDGSVRLMGDGSVMPQGF